MEESKIFPVEAIIALVQYFNRQRSKHHQGIVALISTVGGSPTARQLSKFHCPYCACAAADVTPVCRAVMPAAA